MVSVVWLASGELMLGYNTYIILYILTYHLLGDLLQNFISHTDF